MTTRRDFMKAAAVAGGAMVLGIGREAAAKTVAIPLAQVPKLREVGGSTIIKVGGEEIMLIRESTGSVKALSPLCTHAACYVSYNPKAQTLDCACHRSSFALNGKPKGGPATQPLPTFRAELDGDRILIRGVE